VSIKVLLDDAAAQATAGLRIDLEQAGRLARLRRSKARRRASALMASAAAVAAVVALIAVLVPGSFPQAAPVTPASAPVGPIGLPSTWFYTPPWTPPVTRHPMFAASMALGPAQSSPWKGAGTSGPVLVSSDGTQYASLPWSDRDDLLALSADGRNVAWVTQGGGHNRPVVHRIQLSDGRRRNVLLGKGVQVQQLLWDGDALAVVGSGQRPEGNWVLAADSNTPRRVPEKANVDASAQPTWEPNGESTPTVVVPIRGPGSAGLRTASVIRQPPTLGERSMAAPSFWLRISGGEKDAEQRIPIVSDDLVVSAQALAWAGPRVVVVRVQTENVVTTHWNVSLRTFDLDAGTSRVVSRRGSNRNYPVAVAGAVVAQGTSVAAVQLDFAKHDRSHVRFLLAVGWSAVDGQIKLLALGFLALVVIVMIRRRRSAQADTGHPAVHGEDGAGG
jgi:hypothetical protein